MDCLFQGHSLCAKWTGGFDLASHFGGFHRRLGLTDEEDLVGVWASVQLNLRRLDIFKKNLPNICKTWFCSFKRQNYDFILGLPLASCLGMRPMKFNRRSV